MGNTIIGKRFLPVRRASQHDFTDDTLTDFTGWSFDGLAGRSYDIEVTLIYFLSTASDGFQIAIGGSATFTAIRCAVEFLDWSAGYVVLSQLTAKDTPVGTAASNLATVKLRGTVVVNAAGTVKIRGSCAVNTTGTCSVVAGSVFEYQLAQ